MPTLTQLFEAGAHYGHRKGRSYAKMRPFLYGTKSGIMIINLERTIEGLQRAIEFLSEAQKLGKTILFVGSKRQAKESIEMLSKALAMPSVTYRWLGGMLTNFESMRGNVARLEELRKLQDDETFSKRPKAEQRRLIKELQRLERAFGGVVALKKIPDVLFVIDPHEEAIAVEEARRLGVPVVALCDTDARPEFIDYPIPLNDDAPRAVELACATIKDALVSDKQHVTGDKKAQETVTEDTDKKSKPAITPKATKTKARTKSKVK